MAEDGKTKMKMKMMEGREEETRGKRERRFAVATGLCQQIGTGGLAGLAWMRTSGRKYFATNRTAGHVLFNRSLRGERGKNAQQTRGIRRINSSKNEMVGE